MDLISARCRPNTFSIASEISPTVALARAASIASANRLPLPSPALRGQRRQRVDNVLLVALFLEPRQLVDLQPAVRWNSPLSAHRSVLRLTACTC